MRKFVFPHTALSHFFSKFMSRHVCIYGRGGFEYIWCFDHLVILLCQHSAFNFFCLLPLRRQIRHRFLIFKVNICQTCGILRNIYSLCTSCLWKKLSFLLKKYYFHILLIIHFLSRGWIPDGLHTYILILTRFRSFKCYLASKIVE